MLRPSTNTQSQRQQRRHIIASSFITVLSSCDAFGPFSLFYRRLTFRVPKYCRVFRAQVIYQLFQSGSPCVLFFYLTLVES